MAEGDTIHRIANDVAGLLQGDVPQEIVTPHPRHCHERWPERLAGRAVRSADAHGKHLFLRFEGDLTIHSHLRMSGAWSVCGPDRRWPRSPDRAWLVLRARQAVAVQFDGPLLALRTEADLRRDARLRALGPDVLAETLDEAGIVERLRRRDPTRPIGEALLDQRVIAGIGNLWKAEAFFAAGLDPWRLTGEVSNEETLAAIGHARAGMAEAVRLGRQARPRAVYRRAGMPCPRCGSAIRSHGQGEESRTTYWCPRCQR